jgi:PAS domain S-box-containing protein
LRRHDGAQRTNLASSSDLDQQFRLLVESVRDYAIFMLDPGGYILSWNRGAERIKGYTAGEIIGRHFSIFYPASDLAAGKPQRILDIARAQGSCEDEGWRVRKGGTRFWANVIVTAVRDRQGRLEGFAKITRDLTERRTSRQQLVTSRHQARDLAVANEAKDEFLGLVSHELRTPLTVIYGNACFLASHIDELDVVRRHEALAALVDEADKFRTLVENLLALAHANLDDSIHLERQSVDEATGSALGVFRKSAPLRRILFASPPRPVFAVIESTFFERILINLLDNADKYSPAEQPIEVMVSEDGERVAVEVLDHGVGVAEAELADIFGSFYRSSNTSKNIPGKGLGLGVCRRLLEVMDGKIAASSRPGGGLIVRFSLPLAAASARATASAQ